MDNRQFSLLYPVLDYFNHQTGAKVEWEMEKGSFELKLYSPVKVGQQIFNNYGPKSNEECEFTDLSVEHFAKNLKCL